MSNETIASQIETLHSECAWVDQQKQMVSSPAAKRNLSRRRNAIMREIVIKHSKLKKVVEE